jgi:hypothetical protein
LVIKQEFLVAIEFLKFLYRRRVTLSIDNKTVNAYFCVNLYKLVENGGNNENLSSAKLNFKFTNLKCKQCGVDECESFFDYKKLFRQQQQTADISNTQIELFSQFNIIQSQEINFNNSILDSLEETGYFGNVSFQAVVQRLFKMKIKSNMLR